MPNIKSAKKRVLTTQKKNQQNRSQISALKTAVKKFNFAIDTNNIEEAESLLPGVFSIIDSCCQKGIIHKHNAANKKSALAKRLSDVKSGKLEIIIKKDNKTVAAEKAAAAQASRDAARAEFQRQAAERKAKAIEQAEAKAKANGGKAVAPKKATAKKAEPKAEEEKKPSLEEKLKSKKTPAPAPAPKTEKPAAPKKAPAKKAEPKTDKTE